ncbi:molybdenum cofactor biosynthesis protein MoaB [Rhodocaloribacter litoris]|uniref:MogA/MoaB family molybdenum cofactor biosynthesis protein n=1 Tax=Rhodocaloribacter litoris TaxID=2558931 RepID=UPI001423D188|nr:molybdenum cofactor biosynthesis protein B [Rhodocaloribacter litoris]QXD15056.1 molybdenum cofactor biosynthesis protein MoaB [Rhodocaloribacter litoris]GIV62149.1 MAG: molybdenum cofactor biosynthesis protein B [Rhodothermaceae bacterium]
MSYETHKEAARETPVRCAVFTVSDTRTEATDLSGALMKSRLSEAGCEVACYRIIPDEPDEITALLDAWAGRVEVILFNGGTGISRRDTTYDALSARLEKTLPGFGELFRMLSFEEIGPGAMLSRATAGVYRDTLVFATPGSTNAVRLALDRLIVPELRHLVWEILRQA